MLSAKNNQNGFSLLELIVAIFIVTTAFLAISGLISYSLRTASTSKSKLVASFLAQEGIEIVRYIREAQADWPVWYAAPPTGDYKAQYNNENLISFTETPLLINDSGYYQYDSGAQTPFYRKIILNKLSDNELKVEAEVKWNDRGTWRYVKVEDRLWNWR